MNIGFCFNVFHDDQKGMNSQRDFDSPENISAITQTLRSLNNEVVEIEADERIFFKLAQLKGKIDLVFNIAEGLYGDARESWVPLACEILTIPYTHSSPTVQALKLNKALAKLAVAGLGIRVPQSITIGGIEKVDWGKITFPAIIKPNSEGSSIGIFDANVVDNEGEAENRIFQLRAQGLRGELLAEEYIEGREFTVGMIGNGKEVQVLPIVEQNFAVLPPGMKRIASYELKWLIEDQLTNPQEAVICPAQISRKQEQLIRQTSIEVYTRLGVRDCARIDYRMDEQGKLYFIEINTLPGLVADPKVISYFPLAAKKAGMNFKDLISRIIEEAKRRYGLKD